VRTNKTGTYQVHVEDNDNIRIIGSTYTVSTANTWQKVTVTLAGDTTGSLDNDNGDSFAVFFALVAGTDNSSGAVPTAWEAKTNADRGAGLNVNLADATSNYWQISGLQMEIGDVATPFEHESFAETLQKCQRYYQKSFHYVTPPGSATPSNHELQFSFGTATTLIAGAFVVLPVQLRANPTITFYDNAGTSGKVSKFSGGGGRTDNITLNVARGLENRINVRIYASSAAGVGFMYQVDAEL